LIKKNLISSADKLMAGKSLQVAGNHVNKLLALTFLLLIFLAPAFSIELPVIFTWDSLNSGYYIKAQTNKDISWNEYYRIGIEVDSVDYKQVRLMLKMNNRADFLKNYLELNEIQLTYSSNNWSVAAASKPIGYGRINSLNPYAVISPTDNEFLHQDSRFNGVGVSYEQNDNNITLGAGGNVQNQAMVSLAATLGKPGDSLLLSFSSEARAMDSHWRTPVAISAVKLMSISSIVKLNSELAISYYPSRDRTHEHISTFTQVELGINPSPINYLYLSAISEELEQSGLMLKQLQSSFSHDIKQLSLTAGLCIDLLGHDASNSYHVLGEWRFTKEQRLGIIYRWEENNNISSKHYVGIQAELKYGI